MNLLSTLCTSICLLLLPSTTLFAQINITYPIDRQVVQRDNNNQATVQIAGSYSVALDKVEARFVSILGGLTTDWATVQTNPTNGQFTGLLTAQGGWYRIEVRGRLGNQIVGTHQLARFGVGEILVIFGHSNAQGTTCNNNNECLSPGGATDERVISVPINTNIIENPAYDQYLRTADPKYLPGLTFSQWTTNSGAAPFNSNSWLWGRLGDLLVQRLNVPVLFYGAGFGGTNMEHTYLAMNNQYFEHGFCKWELQMPYANVRNIMNLYVPSTGVRGVLVIHGENDRYTAQESIRTFNREVMKQTRTKFGKDRLAWVIALSSYVRERFDNVRNAQVQAVADINNDPMQAKVFLGPDMDPPAGTTGSTPERPDGAHYSTAGQLYYAQLWADNLTADNNAFFRNSTPYPAEQQPLATIQCATDYQMTLSQPTGYAAYTWNTGSTERQYQTGAGTYSARLQRGDMSNAQTRDAMRIYFPPAIVLTNDRKIPETPTIAASGTVICGASVTLTSSYTGLTLWNTGATTQSIPVSVGGTYSVRAKNSLYDCQSPSSPAVSVASGAADVSLSSHFSRRVVNVGDTLRMVVRVQNEGPCPVAGVQIQDRLPVNLAFVSAATGVVTSGTLLTDNLPLLAAAESISRSYIVRATALGTYVNAFQITNSPITDPDSQPNSGTGDGQDDMAVVDFRALQNGAGGSSTVIYSSANPNQTPLPAVVGNQPAPDAAKADLSLFATTGTRVASVGELVSCSVTVRNSGGLTATNAGVRITLPAGMLFNSSQNNLTSTGNLIEGTIASVAAGSSHTVVFRADITSAVNSVLRVKAEISRADQTDPDSTTGNGSLAKGEDDETQIELRVMPVR